MTSTVTEIQPEPKSARPTRLSRKALRVFLLLALILAAVIVLGTTIPNFLSVNNLINIVRQSSVTEIAVFGATFVVVAGEIDLSVGAAVVLSDVMVAWTSQQGFSMLGMILLALATGLIIGTLNGWLILKLKVPSFLATLGTLLVGSGLALTISLNAIPVTNHAFVRIFESTPGGVPVPVIITIGIFVISLIFFNFTRFGIWTRAVGSSEVAARLGGLNAGRHKYIVLVMGSMFAAIAGIVLAGQTDMGIANSEVGLELVVIAAVILGGGRLGGGAGSLVGSALGALFLTLIFVGLSMGGLPGPYQDIARGLAIGVAILLMKL